MVMTGKKKVYCIIGVGYTKEMIKEEIEKEGYDYLFNIGGSLEMIKAAKEVWCFGDCAGTDALRVATDRGKDIWYM